MLSKLNMLSKLTTNYTRNNVGAYVSRRFTTLGYPNKLNSEKLNSINPEYVEKYNTQFNEFIANINNFEQNHKILYEKTISTDISILLNTIKFIDHNVVDISNKNITVYGIDIGYLNTITKNNYEDPVIKAIDDKFNNLINNLRIGKNIHIDNFIYNNLEYFMKQINIVNTNLDNLKKNVSIEYKISNEYNDLKYKKIHIEFDTKISDTKLSEESADENSVAAKNYVTENNIKIVPPVQKNNSTADSSEKSAVDISAISADKKVNRDYLCYGLVISAGIISYLLLSVNDRIEDNKKQIKYAHNNIEKLEEKLKTMETENEDANIKLNKILKMKLCENATSVEIKEIKISIDKIYENINKLGPDKINKFEKEINLIREALHILVNKLNNNMTIGELLNIKKEITDIEQKYYGIRDYYNNANHNHSPWY